MAILNVYPNIMAQVGQTPKISIYIDTNNTLAQVTATGFLNELVSQGISFSQNDMAMVLTRSTPSAKYGTPSIFNITKSGNNWSLVPSVSFSANDIIVGYSPANYTPDGSGGTSPANSVAGNLHGIDNALGKIGNYLNQPTDPADAATLVSGTPANVVLPFIQPLPPGEWDVWGQVVFVPAGTTTATSFTAAISPTSATLPPLGGQINTTRIDGTFGAAQTVILNVGPVRYSDATAIQYAYLVAKSTFAVNVMQAYGVLTAVRTLKA